MLVEFVLVVEVVVVVDLLADLMGGVEQTDYLVPLCGSVDLLHDSATSTST